MTTAEGTTKAWLASKNGIDAMRMREAYMVGLLREMKANFTEYREAGQTLRQILLWRIEAAIDEALSIYDKGSGE